MSTVAWLTIFVITSVLSLLWATAELARIKFYDNEGTEYPHYLEFNSSFAVLVTITATIFTSVILGYFIARFIQPGDNGAPNFGVAALFFGIWLVVLLIDIPIFMKAKVVHLWWPKEEIDYIYPVTIAGSIAFTTLLTISALTVTASVVAFLIAQNVAKAF